MADIDEVLKILKEQNKRLDKIEKILAKEKPSKDKPISKSISVKKRSTAAMLLLFKEDNFFDQPRTLNDIVKKFKEESRIISPSGLTLPLQKLVRSRSLGRTLKNGKWTYVKR